MAGVGVNVSPGWGNTVDGQNIPQMERVLTDFRPHTARMPWVDNASEREALRFNAASGIDTLAIDNETWTPEQVVAEIAQAAADGLPVVAIEGINEPDVPPTGYTPTEVPISADRLAEVADRQRRLYDAVAGRWPVLCPSSVYRLNEPALNALACDYVSAHRYAPQDGTPPEPYDAELPATDKPVWVTETGFSTYKKGTLCVLLGGKYVITPELQRDYLIQMDSMLRTNGAARVLIYSLQNTGQNPCKAGNNWGLYTWDGQPKVAALALRDG